MREPAGLAQVAYVPQAAFIYNATVRENILFGLPYEEQRYQRAIQGASLGPDLLLLTGAKPTEKALVVAPMRWGAPKTVFAYDSLKKVP